MKWSEIILGTPEERWAASFIEKHQKTKGNFLKKDLQKARDLLDSRNERILATSVILLGLSGLAVYFILA